jgi:hypothetical protein
LLVSSVLPETDAIELKNLTDEPIDVGGWFLSDSTANYRKYRFPDATRIEAGARLVLRETDFNQPGNPASLVPFAFDGAGEEAFLVETNPEGALLRFIDAITYGSMPRGVALGRWPDGTGPMLWLESHTFGTSNALPLPGYAVWAAATFAPDTPSELALPTADPDGDGLSNFAEYAFVLSPVRQDANPLKAGAYLPGGEFTFTYRTRAGAANLGYRVDVSTDLVTWDQTGASVEVLSQSPQPDGALVIVARLLPDKETSNGVRSRFVRVGLLQ